MKLPHTSRGPHHREYFHRDIISWEIEKGKYGIGRRIVTPAPLRLVTQAAACLMALLWLGPICGPSVCRAFFWVLLMRLICCWFRSQNYVIVALMKYYRIDISYCQFNDHYCLLSLFSWSLNGKYININHGMCESSFKWSLSKDTIISYIRWYSLISKSEKNHLKSTSADECSNRRAPRSRKPRPP